MTVSAEEEAEERPEECPPPSQDVCNHSATTTTDAHNNVPPWLFHGNPEALAWAIDSSVSLVSFVGTGAFLGTALLKLAKDSVGCPTQAPSGQDNVPDCNERVHGVIKPSSLLSTVITIVGLLLALTMPLMGAIVDYTSLRRATGRLSVTLYCTILFLTIFVSESTWFAIALLQIPWAFLAWYETTLLYSYLPELTTSETILNGYTKLFAAISYISLVLYMGVVVGVSASGVLGGGDDNDDNDNDDDDDTASLEETVATARLAQSISFTVCVIGYTLAWFVLFQPRPAAHTLPEHLSIWTAGFCQVGRTTVQIAKRHFRLRYFYMAVAFCDPAVMAINILALTYLEDVLDFSIQETGTALVVMILMGVPGSFVSAWITACASSLISSMIAVGLLLLNTSLVAMVLTGPGQQLQTYILGGVWGLAVGWKFTADRMVLVSVLPAAGDAPTTTSVAEEPRSSKHSSIRNSSNEDRIPTLGEERKNDTNGQHQQQQSEEEEKESESLHGATILKEEAEDDLEDEHDPQQQQQQQQQNAELMGFYVFARQVLAWLPPLVFTVLNEQGGDDNDDNNDDDDDSMWQRIAMASLNVFFALALVAYLFLLQSSRKAVAVVTPAAAENM